MSRIDERIRRELQGLARPVETEGVADRVSRRKDRRRVVRRAQVGALVAVVLVGSMAGVYGLLRVFGPREERPAGDGATVLPTPSLGPGIYECDTSRVDADVTGDGVIDSVAVYWPSDPSSTCEPPTEGKRYQVRVDTSIGTPEAASLEPQELPECETPFSGCKAFGAPDVDGDGRAEVAIAIAPGGPATFYGLYWFDAERQPGDPVLVRYSVDPPGDPWHEEYGFPPGPALLMAYGSVTHQHWVACLEEQGIHYLVASTALRSEEDPHLYDVHSTVFGVAGASLEVLGTEQKRVPEDRLEPLDHLCGSPLFVRD